MPSISPGVRRAAAAAHFWLSLVGGAFLTWKLPPEGPDQSYQRVLLAISFYAITITSLDWWQTSDVRAEQSG